MSSADVNALLFENALGFSRIPRNIEQFFPNIFLIDWFRGELTTVSANDLKPFPNLIVLYINFNRLVSLDGNLLQYTPSIREIYFDNNLLDNVGFNLLANSVELEIADFRNNRCVSILATEPEEMITLNNVLPFLCPPLISTDPTTTISTTTTESNQCTARCSINDEADELKRRLNEQEETIKAMKLNYDSKLEILDKQMRELASSPCSCSPR